MAFRQPDKSRYHRGCLFIDGIGRKDSLTHLFVCREYPPAAYPPGGIGTYVRQISHLLAEAGETVHVIAHRWTGAPDVCERKLEGRLTIHRVALDEPPVPQSPEASGIPQGMLASSYPSQAFSWHAALLAERLIATEGIDVVEAQEWEAPLYYLQLRRALHLGPTPQPPCVVHMHSPTEQIFAANGWETTVADYQPAAELEAYSIAAADAVLCPSRYVADQTIARYHVDPATLTVIPYPLGDAPHVERAAAVWAANILCHVGRLEPRKGVLELVEAVAQVAGDTPDVRVEFVGGDTPLHATGGSSVQTAMLARVPRRVRRHLRFHGTQDRRGVIHTLSQVFASIVPSRWENFPYSCIEAMASGLPVVASPNGGMREMIVDGESGWIAADGTPAGLSDALRRALSAPPALRASMGAAAEDTVRRLCHSRTIVDRHLAMKHALVRAGASRSKATQTVSRPDGPTQTRRDSHPTGGGTGVIVIAAPSSDGRACVASLGEQLAPPAAVCIVSPDPLPPGTRPRISGQWYEIIANGEEPARAEARAARVLLERQAPPDVLMFVEARARLHRSAVAACADVFSRDLSLGVLSAWTRETAPGDRVHIQPCPTVPYIWHDEEVAPWTAVRAAAYLDAVRAFGGSTQPSRRNMLDHIARAGWTTITYPAFSRRLPSADAIPRPGQRGSVTPRWHLPCGACTCRCLSGCVPLRRRIAAH